jgi:hypothetical protein
LSQKRRINSPPNSDNNISDFIDVNLPNSNANANVNPIPILEALERYGQIMKTDEQDNAYLMILGHINVYPAVQLLLNNAIEFSSSYNKEFNNYEVDFKL